MNYLIREVILLIQEQTGIILVDQSNCILFVVHKDYFYRLIQTHKIKVNHHIRTSFFQT